MCGIPSTWYDPSTVIFTVEEFFEYRKKEKILPVTVEESCQSLLNNCTSDC